MNKSCIVVTVMVFSILSAVFLNTSMGASSPWLNGWAYRQSHLVIGTTSVLTDYQIKIIVHNSIGKSGGSDVFTNGHAKADFGDIRFTANDGTTLLNYWLQEIDGDSAVFWIKLPVIAVNPGSTILYVYYGNANAETVSDASSVFVYFNDFSNGTDFTPDNGTNWQLDAANSQYNYLGGGYRQVHSWLDIGMSSNDGYRVEVKGKDSVGFDSGIWTRYETGFMYGGIYTGKGEAGSSNVGYVGENSGYHIYLVYSPAGTGWHVYDSSNFGQQHVASIDGIIQYNGSIDFHLNATKIALSAWAGYPAQYDWVFVAKYMNPEPAQGAWLPEESIFRGLSLTLFGAFDYGIAEEAKIKVLAELRDPVTMQPVSGANMTIQVFNPNDTLWISTGMTETSNGTGIYEWHSPDIIANMKPEVGVYYARVAASIGISSTTQMIAFHVDPPAPSTGIAVPESLLAPILILAIGGMLIGAILIKRRQPVMRK